MIVIVIARLVYRSDRADFQARANRMQEIVTSMPGYLGSKSYTAADGEEIALWRFESEEALEAWRTHPEHLEAQTFGRESIYEFYWAQISRVIRQYEFKRGEGRRQIPADEPGWPAYAEEPGASSPGTT